MSNANNSASTPLLHPEQGGSGHPISGHKYPIYVAQPIHSVPNFPPHYAHQYYPGCPLCPIDPHYSRYPVYPSYPVHPGYQQPDRWHLANPR